MKPRGYSIVKISRKAEATVLAGHPWVYKASITSDSVATLFALVAETVLLIKSIYN